MTLLRRIVAEVSAFLVWWIGKESNLRASG